MVFGPHDKGVGVHDSDNIKITLSKPTVLQGWCNEQGLWMVPLADNVTSIEAMDLAFSVYELPSIKEVVNFLHAALGFPTKAMLLTAIRNGNLVTFPGLTVESVTNFFSELDETQKGHMQ